MVRANVDVYLSYYESDMRRFESEFVEYIEEKTNHSMLGFALRVLSESKEEVPVLTGWLRRTGMFQRPMKDAEGSIFVEWWYDTPYATIQHEEPSFRHKPPTKFRYLIDPVLRNIDAFLNDLSAFLERG